MANISTNLLESITIQSTPKGVTIVFPYAGDKAKGIGYTGNSNGMHTVQYTTTNSFIGVLKTQATLATDPQEADWFDVDNTTLGDGIHAVTDQTLTYNFVGNFVWVRAMIVSMSQGEINRVLFTHN